MTVNIRNHNPNHCSKFTIYHSIFNDVFIDVDDNCIFYIYIYIYIVVNNNSDNCSRLHFLQSATFNCGRFGITNSIFPIANTTMAPFLICTFAICIVSFCKCIFWLWIVIVINYQFCILNPVCLDFTTNL